jgi:hypothetical protein
MMRSCAAISACVSIRHKIPGFAVWRSPFSVRRSGQRGEHFKKHTNALSQSKMSLIMLPCGLFL